jgi:hypothetical protein
MLPQIVPQLLETLTGRAIPAHRANDHEMGTQMRAPRSPWPSRPGIRKSHSESQRGPASGDSQPHRAATSAGQVPSEPCWATPSDTRKVTGGQGVAGSNPAVPTQVKGWFRVSATSFWLQWERTCAPIRCADQAAWRALPCRHPDQRLLALSTSACWFPPFPADSGELSPGQGSPIQTRPSKTCSGQQQPQRGSADQRLPLCPAWVLAALRRRPHGPSDAHCHRRRSVRRSANWWPFSRSCDCHRR